MFCVSRIGVWGLFVVPAFYGLMFLFINPKEL